jgi:hypothetical protein
MATSDRSASRGAPEAKLASGLSPGLLERLRGAVEVAAFWASASLRLLRAHGPALLGLLLVLLLVLLALGKDRTGRQTSAKAKNHTVLHDSLSAGVKRATGSRFVIIATV